MFNSACRMTATLVGYYLYEYDFDLPQMTYPAPNVIGFQFPSEN